MPLLKVLSTLSKRKPVGEGITVKRGATRKDILERYISSLSYRISVEGLFSLDRKSAKKLDDILRELPTEYIPEDYFQTYDLSTLIGSSFSFTPGHPEPMLDAYIAYYTLDAESIMELRNLKAIPDIIPEEEPTCLHGKLQDLYTKEEFSSVTIYQEAGDAIIDSETIGDTTIKFLIIGRNERTMDVDMDREKYYGLGKSIEEFCQDLEAFGEDYISYLLVPLEIEAPEIYFYKNMVLRTPDIRLGLEKIVFY